VSELAGLHPTLAHHLVSTLGWTELRPLQQAAIAPVVAGQDALLLAPTAGGKTEAASFPVLSRMAAEGWTGLSALYLCPLKALLNNLLPRLETYGGWTGRRVALWHGDTTGSRRRAILADPPDLLLTTPESLESMLVSANVDHRRLFADLQVIVVDEVHAFGSGDRGWHLLAVLERLTRLCGRPLQRIGLSATVGNPDALLRWLQGSSAGKRPGTVVASEAKPGRDAQNPGPFGNDQTEPELDIQLDYVGTVENAAKVITALHRGEKRLVFCDSKRLVELLGAELRARGVTTHLVHASLSLDERRRAEQAFTVLHGRNEIGRIDAVLLVDWVAGPRLLLLGGRSWRVTWTDWKRRRCFVEPAESGGRARWFSNVPGGISYELARAMRDVLLGAEPPVTFTRRAAGMLAGLRSDSIGRARPCGTVVSGNDDDLRWWTWAGYRVNATLKATLGDLADESQRVDDLSVRLRADLRPQTWSTAMKELREHLCLPEIDDKALAGLKFSDALPRHLAVATLATRLADLDHAAAVLAEPSRFER
jgi:Lhr-like helicase